MRIDRLTNDLAAFFLRLFAECSQSLVFILRQVYLCPFHRHSHIYVGVYIMSNMLRFFVRVDINRLSQWSFFAKKCGRDMFPYHKLAGKAAKILVLRRMCYHTPSMCRPTGIGLLFVWFTLSCTGKTTPEFLEAKFMGNPTISPAYPTNGATDVAVSPRILFTSTQKLKIESLSAGVELKQGATNISFSVSAISDNVYELTPTVSLTGGSSHLIRYTKGIVSVFGSSPAADTEVTFTTQDIDAPTVQSHNVANLSEGTTVANLSITFNKSVTGVALASNSITVSAADGCLNCASVSGLAGSGAGLKSCNRAAYSA